MITPTLPSVSAMMCSNTPDAHARSVKTERRRRVCSTAPPPPRPPHLEGSAYWNPADVRLRTRHARPSPSSFYRSRKRRAASSPSRDLTIKIVVAVPVVTAVVGVVFVAAVGVAAVAVVGVSVMAVVVGVAVAGAAVKQRMAVPVTSRGRRRQMTSRAALATRFNNVPVDDVTRRTTREVALYDCG